MKKETLDRIDYFKEYYLGKTVICIIVLALTVFLIFHFVTKKDMVSGVCPVSLDPMDSVATDSAYFDPFLEQNGYDPRKYSFNVITDVYLSADMNDDVARTNANLLQNVMLTRSADIYLAREDIFAVIASSGYMADLRTVLGDDFESLDSEGRIFYYEGVPVGVRTDPDNAFLNETGWYSGTVVIGILEEPKSEELSYSFLRSAALE